MADYSWVSKRIAVGGRIESLADVRVLASRGITHILNLREENEDEKPWCKQVGIEYLHNGWPNDPDEEPGVDWFKRSIDWAWKVLSDPKARLHVHCKGGHMRSPSTAYAILRSFGWSVNDAVKLLVEGRVQTDMDELYKDAADKAIAKLGYGDLPK